MSKNGDQPVTCSIGLPVYNGENYLRDAIDSALAQEFQDFELIIADNASTDGTEAICREYAEKDERIHYVRHPRNIGAAKNYNYVFHCSKGQYFNWLAHDDVLGPSFLSTCLDAFSRSDATKVLVYPSFSYVDEQMEEIPSEIPKCVETNAGSPTRRMFEVLEGLGIVTSVFGMFRREELAKTRLIGSFIGSDYVLLMECGLLGKIERIDAAPQFKRRLHDEGSQRANKTRQEVAEWFDPESRADKKPHRRLSKEYFWSVASLPDLSVITRLSAATVLVYQRLAEKVRVMMRKR